MRQNMGLVNDSRRAQIVVKEFAETMFMQKQENV